MPCGLKHRVGCAILRRRMMRGTAQPNTAFQLTASRARSLVFDVISCSALAAAECQTVRRHRQCHGKKSADYRSHMFTVRVSIVQWIDDAQPGIVACQLIHAWGNAHTFVDKLPIFTAANLDRQSVYPQPGWIACQVIDQRQDADGRNIMTVDTEQPWHVGSTTDTTQFT